MNVDVVVVGAGITGITTAHLLKETGLTVVLIERERVASIDTGDTTAHLTCITDVEPQELARSLGDDHAQAAWDAVAAAIDEIQKIVQDEQNDDFNAWSIGPNNKVNESKPTKRGQLFRRFLVRLTKCNGFRWAPQ